jgi:hypothetical protein
MEGNHNMSNATSEDFKNCEMCINALLSPEEIRAINSSPIWELSPPQREEYISPMEYANGMKNYAKRVLSYTEKY